AFDGLKTGNAVVYPMSAQMRLLIDATVVGEQRIFGLEGLAGDPLFVELAGGTVPSIDTVYRDLTRMDSLENAKLELIMAQHGLDALSSLRLDRVHCDIDTTVEPLFGEQEGAELGYNPRYPGRRSYHPILAMVAETGTCIGARLRPGDTGLGDDDASLIRAYVSRVVSHVPAKTGVVVRIDAGADCTRILSAINDVPGSLFVVKARLTPDLAGEVMMATHWTTVDEDADGEPTVQVAELTFQRDEWVEARRSFRVIAVRRRDRDTGKQVQLWSHLDYTVQVFITNDTVSDPWEIAQQYDGRAEIEPRIAELKNGVGIGKVPTGHFEANHAMMLLKLLAHNLMRAYVTAAASDLPWRGPWLVRALLRVPGRLSRSGRQLRLHTPPASRLHQIQRHLC
ncbi:MAG: IS1380 family transposase, partial [Halothiobacillaceae bacterium]|nr:IS1380 family transposase [Halothiobacillaceae bacterium]